MRNSKTKSKKADNDFDKFKYYSDAVQGPEADLSFLKKTFFSIFNKPLEVLAEDFCAAYLNCCIWVKQNSRNKAIAIDLDPEPLKYGKSHYENQLSDEQKSRLNVLQRDVLDPTLPKSQLIAALNFSYYIFKERELLKAYFENCFHRLEKEGLLILDCFGGSDCFSPNEHETIHDNFSYFWDQENYNVVTGEAIFHIHFKRPGEKKRKNVFTYDWRIWTLPELRDLLQAAGFTETIVYWEGTSKTGDGNGVFKPTLAGEDCESWVAYVVAVKRWG